MLQGQEDDSMLDDHRGSGKEPLREQVWDHSYMTTFGRFLITLYIGYVFIYLGFYVAFNTVQVISRRVVGRAEETST